MSNKQKVLELLGENPKLTNEQLAQKLGTTKGYIGTAVWELRKEGKLPAFDGKSGQKADRHTGLEQECEAVGIPINSVGHYWYKGKHYSIHAKANELSYLQAIEDIVRELPARKLKSTVKYKTKRCVALNVTLADMHVGMDTNPNGRALFGYEYNGEIFRKHLDIVFEKVMKEYHLHGKFDVLVLDDLGDGLDGWDGFTTRGGHALPQNMDNVGAFKTYVFGKLDLIERLHREGIANKIYVRTVTNCNHSGNFGHTANIAIQMMIERWYEKAAIEYVILERFMEHFTYGDHAFILTHGKDTTYMKSGLPYKLTPIAENFINDYIDHYGITQKYIHLHKGDLHQIGYERTNKFDYRNFMSFAPPSAYGQHNYGDGYGGFSIQVIPKHSNEISHADYFFEFTKQTKLP